MRLVITIEGYADGYSSEEEEIQAIEQMINDLDSPAVTIRVVDIRKDE